MPLYTVSQLKASLHGGAKTDKFTIEFGTPAGDGSLTLGVDGPILCKATSFAQKTIGHASAFAQGRELKLPGNSEFDTWEVTFYQTPDHNLRKMFIKWMSAIDNFGANTHTCDPDAFMTTAKVIQLGCNGEDSAHYEFFNLWPSMVSEVQVDAETVNTLQQFQVTFTYSHWE